MKFDTTNQKVMEHKIRAVVDELGFRFEKQHREAGRGFCLRVGIALLEADMRQRCLAQMDYWDKLQGTNLDIDMLLGESPCELRRKKTRKDRLPSQNVQRMYEQTIDVWNVATKRRPCIR